MATRRELSIVPERAGAGPGPSAFISYARVDGTQLAVRLDRALRRRGIRTWLYQRDMDESSDFTYELEQAIVAQDFLIACITPDVQREDSFVRREIVYALACSRRVAVARFAPVLPPISIVSNTYFDFHEGWDSALERLVDFCRGAVLRQPLSASGTALDETRAG